MPGRPSTGRNSLGMNVDHPATLVPSPPAAMTTAVLFWVFIGSPPYGSWVGVRFADAHASDRHGREQ
jgi:hypothetical protein